MPRVSECAVCLEYFDTHAPLTSSDEPLDPEWEQHTAEVHYIILRPKLTEAQIAYAHELTARHGLLTQE